MLHGEVSKGGSYPNKIQRRVINGLGAMCIVGLWLLTARREGVQTALGGHSSTSVQGRKLRVPLLQRNIHISLPLILWCLGIDAQVMEKQRLVTKLLATGRKPIAVNRIDRFADVIR
jgi:hypothetical protein